ncbi:MAG: SDR family NAD(P)-dependent oxidoreductase [Nitriliruptoraceae bacterium]
MKVAGKVIVVTGAGNGIGRQVALECIRRGARVAAVDISQEGLEETVALAAAGDRIAAFTVDLTDREVVHALPQRVTDTLSAPDGVIHVAGIIQPFVRIAELGYDAIQRVIDVNLHGTIHVVKAFVPVLLERPEAHLANVSSMGGFLPVPGQAIYGATKAAVRLMTEALYAELLDTSVGVSVVFPGAVSTDITANSGVEVSRAMADAGEGASFPTTSPEDAATLILDGIEADKLHIFVGRDARMMNLANRVAPRRSTHLITNKMKDLLG